MATREADLALTALFDSSLNTQKHRTARREDPGIDEPASSIRQDRVLQRITVRRAPGDQYEIIMNPKRLSLSAFFFVFVSVAAPGLSFGQVQLSTTELAKRVSPGVVTIRGRTVAGEIAGTGFIVDSSGTIVTSHHVIRDLRSANVVLASGDVYDSASVRAFDERRDLAVIQVAGFDLPTVDLGNSNELQVGDPVLLIGSARGLQGSVTTGIVSAVRDLSEGFKVIQTDAASNPGNSGGPMVNARAQAVGVVGFKVKGSEGLNFAIPINYVRGLLAKLGAPTPLGVSPARSPDQAKPTTGKTAASLSDVQRIYVGHFSDEEGASLLREKIVNRLAQSGRFHVANSPDDADAALVGTGIWESGYVTSFVARLVTGESTILWTVEASPSVWRGGGASTQVADKVVRDLLKALSREPKPKRR